MAKAFAERMSAPKPEGGHRPDIVGYDRTVQELHKVNVTLTHLLRATTRNYGITLPVGPLYPYEVAAVEKARENLAELDADIEMSMKHTAAQRIPRKGA